MQNDKKNRIERHASEAVETPEPPQVMDPSKAPPQSKNSDKKKESGKKNRKRAK
jgi:hypothetical protein